MNVLAQSCARLLTVWLAGAVGAIAFAPAATIVDREVQLVVEGSALVKTERFLVSLTEPSDLERWSFYPLYVSDGTTLEDSVAEILRSDGKVVKRIKRRQFEHVESVGDDLYSTTDAYLVPFTSLQVGYRLRIETTMRNRLPYPAYRLPLLLNERQATLRVLVEGPALRWQIQGSHTGITVREHSDRLEILGESLGEASDSSYASDPRLQLTWSGAGDWSDVGSWYNDFKAEVPREAANVALLASDLVGGIDSPRDRIEILSDYVKQDIRYVSVQIGDGGWIPTAAAEVLERGWGDCKDKAELLLGLLSSVGIQGHMALLKAGWGPPVDAQFPSPFQFNHAIVAIPADAAAIREGDPVSDGLLFIDPTADRGGVEWLLPSSQDRFSLVIRPEGTRIVRTPVSPQNEHREVVFQGKVGPRGGFQGTVQATFSGAAALPWLAGRSSRSPRETAEQFRQFVQNLDPEAVVGEPSWTPSNGQVPALSVVASVSVPGKVRGRSGDRWMRAHSLRGLPEPRFLEDAHAPFPLRIGDWTTEWRLSLPESWCPPVEHDVRAENHVGKFRARTVQKGNHEWILRRQTWVGSSWVNQDSVQEAIVLAQEESRSGRRRVRFRCADDG